MEITKIITAKGKTLFQVENGDTRPHFSTIEQATTYRDREVIKRAELAARLEADRPRAEAVYAKNQIKKARRRERDEAEMVYYRARLANDPTFAAKEEELKNAIEHFGGYQHLSSIGFDLGSLYITRDGNLVGFNHVREGYARVR